MKTASAELYSKTEEILSMKPDNISHCKDSETKLSGMTKQLEVAVEQIEFLTELNENLTTKVDQLSQDLANQRKTEIKTHESYSAEIGTKIKLANAYQQMYRECKDYADCLKEALDEVQDMLEKATKKYINLEAKHKEDELAHEKIIERGNNYVTQLQAELATVKKQLENSMHLKINKRAEDLPPKAVAISNTPKSMSFTELNGKYVAASERLVLREEENARSTKEMIYNEQMMKKMKDEFLSVLDEQLRMSNDALLKVMLAIKDNNVECSRLEGVLVQENARLQRDIADLSRQVCHLLQEVERHRLVCSEKDLGNNLSLGDISTNKLLTFNNVQDLQQNNMKLLSLLRELTEKPQGVETYDSSTITNLTTKAANPRESKQELIKERVKHAKILEELKTLRSTYKNVYSQIVEGAGEEHLLKSCGSITNEIKDSHLSEERGVSRKLEEELLKLKKQIEELKTEMDEYKEETLKNEMMLNEQIESLTKENTELTKVTFRIAAQFQTNAEKFVIMKNNAQMLKKQTTALKKQKMILNDTILKHEETISYLRDDTTKTLSCLTGMKAIQAKLEKENSVLKESETLIRKEYESFIQQMRSQLLIHSNIESIKASLERIESEGTLRLEARLDMANRECSALRRHLKEEQDRFRQLTLHLPNQTQTDVKACGEKKTEAEIFVIPKSYGKRKKMHHFQEANKEIEVAIDEQQEYKAETEMQKNTIRDMPQVSKCTKLKSDLKESGEQLKSCRIKSKAMTEIPKMLKTELKEMKMENKEVGKVGQLSVNQMVGFGTSKSSCKIHEESFIKVCQQASLPAGTARGHKVKNQL